MQVAGIVHAVLALLLLSAAGCAESARFIVKSPAGGTVAIPENTNVWPSYYRDKANKLMHEHCPQGCTIVHEEEVVTGVSTTDRVDTDSHNLGPFTVRDQVSNTTTTRNQTEFRITYQAN
jgi:hypothetical protein